LLEKLAIHLLPLIPCTLNPCDFASFNLSRFWGNSTSLSFVPCTLCLVPSYHYLCAHLLKYTDGINGFF
jgi:hypothetical protein